MSEAAGQERGARALRLCGIGAVVLLLAVALFFRLIGLDHLPGVNGDEAWYGVLAQAIAGGGDPQWRTPTGNLPGPFQVGSLLILQSVLPASFALLRLPTVLSSIAAAALAWWVMRRHFDGPTALIALVLMATLPIGIVYARFGWDPSHGPLIGLVCTAFALRGRRIACAVAFAVALATHPTNIFIGPFLLSILLGVEAERSGWRQAVKRTGLTAALLALTLAVLAVTTSGGQADAVPSTIIPRILDPQQWTGFLLLFSRLLSGDTAYGYITGTGFGSANPPIDFMILLGLFALIGIGGRSLRRRAFGREAGIVTGWLLTLLGFFLIAGPAGLTPDFQRYALCLIVPTILAVAILAREIDGQGTRMTGATVATLLIGLLFLIGFQRQYLTALEETGSIGHRTFWTGPVEPKEAALQALFADPRLIARPVVAEDWWLYWPVAYLAHGHPVTLIDGSLLPPGPLPANRTWLVFAGEALDRRLARTPGAVPVDTVSGTGRAAVLRIWRTGPVSPAPPPSEARPSGR